MSIRLTERTPGEQKAYMQGYQAGQKYEREACAKIADAKGLDRSGKILPVGPSVFDAADQVAASISSAIRARKTASISIVRVQPKGKT